MTILAVAAGELGLFAMLGLAIGLLGLGAAGGFAAGLVGPGAGALLAPGLFALFTAVGGPEDGRIAAALGGALAVAAPLSVLALMRQKSFGLVDGAAALRLAPAAGLGGAVGAGLALSAPPWAQMAACGAGALAFGLQIAFQPIGGGGALRLGGARPLALSFGAGAAASLSGQGGGGFGAVALGLLGAPPARAAATAAALGAASAGCGAAVFAIGGAIEGASATPWSVGYVSLAALALVTPAWALAAPLGAAAAALLPRIPLRLAFAVALSVIGVTFLRAAGTG